MKKTKKTKIFLVVLFSLFIFTAVTVYGDNITKTIQVTYRNISILANGKQIQSEQEPFIYQGHTFVPLRTIGEALSKKVDWDNTKNQVIITDQLNPNPTVRVDSFYSLINYFPDNYKIEHSDEKLDIESINLIEKLSENFSDPPFKLNSDDIIQKSFNLKSSEDNVTLFNFHKKNKLHPGLICLKFTDGSFYFYGTQRGVCGCSDGWNSGTNIQPFLYNDNGFDTFYYFYLTTINSTLLTGKVNRSKQITLLYSVYLNFRIYNENL